MIHTFKKLEKIRETYRGQNFLHFDENIIAQFPKIESSPFVMPTSLVTNFSWIQTKVELIGEEASLVCQAGFQMVISNSSGNRVMEVVDRIRVVCNQEGMWEKPFHYYCHNATWTTTRVYTKKPFKKSDKSFLLLQMLQPSSKDSSLSLQTIAYTLLSIIFFLLLFLLLTFVLRWKRMKVRKKRAELTRVTMPRIHSETNLTGYVKASKYPGWWWQLSSSPISLQKEAAYQHFYHHGSTKEKQLSLYYQPSVQSAFAAQVNGSRGRGHFIGVGHTENSV